MIAESNGLQVLATLSLLAVGGLTYCIVQGDVPSRERGVSLTVHCAAGIKAPVVAIAKRYEEEFDTPIRLTFGGSGSLLSGLTVKANGDIYIAGDGSYVDTARARGLVDEVLTIAEMRPVIAVQPDNPEKIRNLQDLLREGVKYALGNPDAAAVGEIVKATAGRLGIWKELESRAAVFKPTVNDLANDLRLGTVDAAVIWDATARQHGLTIVNDAALAQSPRQVTLGVLHCTAYPRAALHFARYLTAQDRGLPAFAKAGFTPMDGDPWVDVPRLLLMSGAMLRPAIEKTLSEFEDREGIIIERVYNGCGILVSQMRTGVLPDAYFACDQTFLDQVEDRFETGTPFSTNDIVLVTPPGNPRGLHKLSDLLGEGLRIGIGHPEKSALGALTSTMMTRQGLAERLRASGNIAVESPTGDMLVNQLRAGSLDAILVYRSNAAHVAEHVATQTLAGVDGALAVQPYAVARTSAHKQLMGRLRARLGTAVSADRFKSLGFSWQGGTVPR
ncbi:MAG: substrate-binding domain-containing protein [Planctomycetota bacterium]|nr:substrate-binding domain-containing protein [Planctomycetota bacterium]